VDLSYIRQVEAGFQYPRTMMYGFFAKRTDPPSSSLLFWLPASSSLPSPATFPDPLWSPIARSRDFHHASGVGSEEAHKVALMLASVRRSHCTCGFPACSVHEDSKRDAKEGINRTRLTSPCSR